MESDAYHSLSIEGFAVTESLIEKVRQGDWNPEDNETERETKNALAAGGYWLCFQKVKESIRKVFNGYNAGQIAVSDHGEWYRELFAPGVIAGILTPSDLAGYRNTQVYISGSMHIPPNKESVRDAMPVFLELITQEKMLLLGPFSDILFLFTYIHIWKLSNSQVLVRIFQHLLNLLSL